MAGCNRDKVVDRRAKKVERGEKEIKDKFLEEREAKAKPIVGKTENQKIFLEAVKLNTVIVGRGASGVGKTYLAASVAANKLLKGEVDKIVMVRPYVQMGRSSGFWPGTIEQRLEPYFLPMISVLKERLGESHYGALFGKKILIQPMEAVRGMDFKDTLLICDESQNVNKAEMRCLLTRISENSQFIFIGDDRQADIKSQESGLMYLVGLLKKHNINNTAVIEFTSDDVVRHDIVAKFVKIFDEEGSL